MFDDLIDFFDGFLRGFVNSGGTADDLVGCGGCLIKIVKWCVIIGLIVLLINLCS